MHQHAGEISVSKQVLEEVQHLRMQQGGPREFPGGGGASQHEDAGTDDRPDPERRQRPGTEGLLQPVFRAFGVGNQFVDGLLGKKLAGQKASFDAMEMDAAAWAIQLETQPSLVSAERARDPRLPLSLAAHHLLHFWLL